MFCLKAADYVCQGPCVALFVNFYCYNPARLGKLLVFAAVIDCNTVQLGHGCPTMRPPHMSWELTAMVSPAADQQSIP
jgi:hypothetical protein